jgi:adenylate cyclase
LPPVGSTEAERQALLDLAVVALLGSPTELTALDVCEQAGIDRERADRLWRAMGFPDVPDDEVAFTQRDVDAVRSAMDLLRTEVVDDEAVRGQTRVMSQALATIAAAHLEIAEPDERDIDRVQEFVDDVLPALDDLLVYLYRRHLLAAVEQILLRDRDELDATGPTLAVGFADLVGFTSVSNHLEEVELAGLVEHFSEAAADVVAEGAGRVVKMIGDEIMFTAEGAVAAAEIALRLVEEVGDHDGLPALRAGVAAGPVVLRHGDVYGAPANLAHRLVDAARPGTVVVDEHVGGVLEDLDGYEVVRIAGIRRVRGFDRVRVFALRRQP